METVFTKPIADLAGKFTEHFFTGLLGYIPLHCLVLTETQVADAAFFIRQTKLIACSPLQNNPKKLIGIGIFEAIAATLFDSIDKMGVGVIKTPWTCWRSNSGERAAHVKISLCAPAVMVPSLTPSLSIKPWTQAWHNHAD